MDGAGGGVQTRRNAPVRRCASLIAPYGGLGADLMDGAGGGVQTRRNAPVRRCASLIAPY